MSPNISSNDAMDCLVSHTEFRCKFWPVSKFISGSYCSNLLFAQFTVPMVNPLKCTIVGSLLVRTISHVVGLCSKPQMLWSNTCRIIASVKNKEAAWNWAAVDNPRGHACCNAVAANSYFSTWSDLTIASLAFAGHPIPAPSYFWTVGWNPAKCVHLGPKSLWKVFRQSLRFQILHHVDLAMGFLETFSRVIHSSIMFDFSKGRSGQRAVFAVLIKRFFPYRVKESS